MTAQPHPTAQAMASDGFYGPAKLYGFGPNDEGQRLKAKHDPVEARAAQLVACSFASDADEARLLLDMLGLLPEGVSAPADDRRVLGWRTS